MAGVIALGGSHASLHDGVGERTWTPAGTPAATYRLGVGQGTLDLRSLPELDAARTVHITAGAGLIRILVPTSANVRFEANVRMGEVAVDRDGARNRDVGDGGVGVSRRVPAPVGAAGAPLTISIHLADGRIEIERV